MHLGFLHQAVANTSRPSPIKTVKKEYIQYYLLFISAYLEMELSLLCRQVFYKRKTTIEYL